MVRPTATAFASPPRTLMELLGGDRSVSGAGDVNGDGYADVIVAGNDSARCYFGGPDADDFADIAIGPTGPETFFGRSVAGIGDHDGDGYGDLAVGSASINSGGSYAGVYLRIGGYWFLFLDNSQPVTRYGWSVSAAGDLNRDGYADFIVGAPLYDVGPTTDAGKAALWFGGPTGLAGLLEVFGSAVSSRLGTSVSGAGDFNGDGYDDVIVGAPGIDRAYVYYGGAPANATADVTLSSASPDSFGCSVSGAGDMNGDGFDDVIVGAPLNDTGGTDAGRAYVYYGGHTPAARLILTGTVANGRFGTSVSGAGDMNHDGYDDVIVGSTGSSGRAYVYSGGPVADIVADYTVVNPMTPGGAYNVSAAGDVNGDGFADLIYGVAGRVHVITTHPYNLESPDGGEQWIATAPQRVRWRGPGLADLWISYDGGANYSLLLSGVGGGERNDFAVIAPNMVTTAALVRVSAAGEAVTQSSSDVSEAVFAIVAPHDPPAAAAHLALTPSGAAANNAMGISVSAGDINGDGYGDMIAGASGYESSTGRVDVYFGGPGADAVADLTLTAPAPSHSFGASVCATGDVDGDGYPDILVGAPAYFGATGRAFLYFGGPGADNIADRTYTGETFNHQFGRSVTLVDFNRDSYADVIVGAEGAYSFTGRVYVYYGGPAADNFQDLTLDGELANHRFGNSVSGAGDVNGDGCADLVVGALDYAGGAGRAYVYYGGASPNTIADLTLTGQATSHFGRSVSSAGDVNGDGYGDIIVGGEGNGVSTGNAYVFHGGPQVDDVPDATLTGETAGSSFGWAVSSAGDVNADGYADLVVGAIGHGNSRGRAYLYYCGPGADTTADHTFEGEGTGDAFGSSVTSGGDMNGDGHADVIVGAPYNSAGVGRAYAYDLNLYYLESPNGGETWNVGAAKTISWLGAEPADVWLSTDGGNAYQVQETGVGGMASNSIQIRVPHTPTKFARIKIMPSNDSLAGADVSDSLFTIQTSVALLSLLATVLPEGGVSVTWQSDPGPEDLAGYKLERNAGGAEWATVVALTQETTYTDLSGRLGSRYRLFAVNGFGQEMRLGETSIRPLALLQAWPLPYNGGQLSIAFAAGGGLGGGGTKVDLSIYDVTGRLVRRLVEGAYPQGYHTTAWDGQDRWGRRVAAGVYFLRSRNVGEEHSVRLLVLR